MISDSFLINLFFAIPPFMVAIILHEVAHGYVAFKLGDPTAKSLGRITLNPLKHIDPFMSIILPLLLIIGNSPIIFGGAKPVPVNPLYFRNPKRDMAIVAAAGPIVNFIIGGLSYLWYIQLNSGGASSFFGLVLHIWLAYSLIINAALGLFNLLPVPPLDGGRIVVGILPIDLARKWAKLERFGLLIVFILLMLNIPQKILSPAIGFLTKELERSVVIQEDLNPKNPPTPKQYLDENRHQSNELELTKVFY